MLFSSTVLESFSLQKMWKPEQKSGFGNLRNVTKVTESERTRQKKCACHKEAGALGTYTGVRSFFPAQANPFRIAPQYIRGKTSLLS